MTRAEIAAVIARFGLDHPGDMAATLPEELADVLFVEMNRRRAPSRAESAAVDVARAVDHLYGPSCPDCGMRMYASEYAWRCGNCGGRLGVIDVRESWYEEIFPAIDRFRATHEESHANCRKCGGTGRSPVGDPNHPGRLLTDYPMRVLCDGACGAVFRREGLLDIELEVELFNVVCDLPYGHENHGELHAGDRGRFRWR